MVCIISRILDYFSSAHSFNFKMKPVNASQPSKIKMFESIFSYIAIYYNIHIIALVLHLREWPSKIPLSCYPFNSIKRLEANMGNILGYQNCTRKALIKKSITSFVVLYQFVVYLFDSGILDYLAFFG